MNPRLAPAVAGIVLAGVLAYVLPAPADVITVSWQGTAMYTYIQDGIDAASPGDTVEVAPGVYTGPWNRDLDFGGTPLTLVAPGGRDVTTINCEAAGRGFYFHSGEDTNSVVSGFSITGASADSGGGAYCLYGSRPKFADCSFQQNVAGERGGGLCCRNASPVLRGCVFIENVATGGTYPYGGAIACHFGAAPLVANTEFDWNYAKSGGAVYLNSSPATFVGCDFTNNSVTAYGYSGAAASLVGTHGASFTDCSFRDNGHNEPSVGGGIYATNSTVTVTDCEFLDNWAGQGTGIHFTGGAAGWVTGCTFAGNDSDWSAAAGIHFHMSSGPAISGCTFVDNEDDHISLEECSPTIEYSILAFAGGKPVVCETDGEPIIHHCFVYGNAEGDSLCGTSYHDNMFDDPLLCGYPGGDYTLCADSPCLPGVTWPQLVGAYPQGCPACGSPVEPTTWGVIKARYR